MLSVNLSSNIFIKLCSVKHIKLYGLFVKAKNISSCSFEKLKNRRIWSVTYLQLVQESVSYKAVSNKSISYKLKVRLDYQPLFGKGARAPPPSLLGEGRPDTRERRKSSLAKSLLSCKIVVCIKSM